MNKITITTLESMKGVGGKIVAITAYDASFAHLCENAGVDLLLVGDSLGMVVQGYDSTLPVTVDQMVYHTACVVRATEHVLVVADMPFMAYSTTDQALETAARLMKEGGAEMVKLEGGGASARDGALSHRARYSGLWPPRIDAAVGASARWLPGAGT